MTKGIREQNIRRIINMEDRICTCQRCKHLTQCIRRPSLGKGELEPEVMLVFESDKGFTLDVNWIIKLRDMVKRAFTVEKVYHTFMVRCAAKACTTRQNISCYAENKLLDKDYQCLLTERVCDGIIIHPSNEEIMACLSFLLEEIDILSPRYLLLFGDRVSEFVLKSYGIYEDITCDSCYQNSSMIFFTTVQEDRFGAEHCNNLARHINPAEALGGSL